MATRRITVKIGGKEYPMTIKQNDEEKYRRAAKEINKLITAYKASYVAEPEDYLAMAMIRYLRQAFRTAIDAKTNLTKMVVVFDLIPFLNSNIPPTVPIYNMIVLPQ